MQYHNVAQKFQRTTYFIHEEDGLCSVRELVATLDFFGRYINIQIEGSPKLKEPTELRYSHAVSRAKWPVFQCGAWVFSPCPPSLPIAPSGDLAICATSVMLAARAQEVLLERGDDFVWGGVIKADGTIAELQNPLAAGALAAKLGKPLVCGDKSADMAALAGADAYGFRDCEDIWNWLIETDEDLLYSPMRAEYDAYVQPASSLLLEDIVGQMQAKQALIVAAAGGHNMLMVGPPGMGKSALVKRMSSILPAMTRDEMIEVSVIHQSAGLTNGLVIERPVRQIDPGVTRQALVGGGSTNPRPGEVSLAHRGVLFVDEMLQFTRDKLDALRGPLQDGVVPVSRVDFKTTFPARFQLVGATNPCPCGRKNSPMSCTCTKRMLSEYPKRLSGALFDRIPIRILMDCVSGYDVVGMKDTSGITTESAREQVLRAKHAQNERYAGTPLVCNNEVEASTIGLLNIHPTVNAYLSDKSWMSPRQMEAVLKVGRTISDMRGGSQIMDDDVRQALEFVLEAEQLFGGA